MTKFEEEFKALISWDWVNVDLIQKILTKFGNWHSDEEFQEIKESYWNQAESILSMLDEIKSLKSQLQQQALPVVPECVAEYIEDCKKEGNCLFGVFADATRVEHDMPDLVYFWLGDEGNNDELFARAWLDGYTVEKPQLFYLREKNTGYYLRKTGNDVYGITPHYSNDYDEKYMTYKFTQEEIDSMQTGSYEQIEVAE